MPLVILIVLFYCLGMLVGSIWSVFWIPLVFTFTALSFSAYCFFAHLVGRPKLPRNGIEAFYCSEFVGWTTEELRVFREYHVFLRYPLGAKMFSVTLNLFRWSVVLWVPWLLWNQQWVFSSLLALNWIATSGLSVKFDPVFFLSRGIQGASSARAAYYMQELSLLGIVDSRLTGKDESPDES